jgi:hypothetical protein
MSPSEGEPYMHGERMVLLRKGDIDELERSGECRTIWF